MVNSGLVTLCPSINITYPVNSAAVDSGFGYVVFDSYIDPGVSAALALQKVAGNSKISNPRWITNSNGAYALAFTFDNTSGGGASLQLKAKNCRSPVSGRELDGDGKAPNGDDFFWKLK